MCDSPLSFYAHPLSGVLKPLQARLLFALVLVLVGVLCTDVGGLLGRWR